MNILDEKLARLFKEYEQVSNADELISTWLNSNKEIHGTTVLYSFDSIGNKLPIQSVMGKYEHEKFYLQSIFSNPTVYLLNEKVWLDMLDKKKFLINSELLLDTQFGKYALKYINDKDSFVKKDIGSSFDTLFGLPRFH